MALPEDQLLEEDNDFFDYAGDVLAAPFRGVEGALQGAYNLADYLAFDILPDYDTRFLGTSKTMAGGAVEGITQFATGFVPLFGLAGRAGALAKAPITRGIVAGAATDFTFFNGQEARLSNLIQQVPELQNPVTEFLAYDEDEGELEGRMKNVLEGLGLEAVAGVFIKSLKAIKNGRKAKDGGADAVGQAQAVVDTGLEQDLASIKAPRYIDEFRESIIDEFDYRLQEDALSDEVAEAIPDFPKPYRDFLKALEKEDWLGFDYPSQAVNEIITSPTVYDDFEISPALKATVTKLENAFFKGDIAELGVSRRSGIFAGRIDDKTKDFLIKGTQAVESGKPFQTGGTIDPSMPQAATVGKTLDQLAVNADTLEVQNLAKNLKKIIKNEDDLDVVVNYKPDVEGDPTTVRGDVSDKGSIAGVYKPSTDRVELYGSADEQTLVHEMLHGVTAKKINAWVSQGGKDRSLVLSNIDNVISNKAAPKPIRELAKSFKLAAEKVGKDYEFKGTDVFDPKEGKGLYAFKDLDEFLVAAFTDLELQRILRRIPADDQRNIFQKIVDAVAELIGTIRGKEGSNLLDKVLRDSAQIISASRDTYIGKATKQADEGLASVKQEMPDFKKGADEVLQAIPEKFRGYADELMKGGTPRLPRFGLETGDDVIVLKDLLEQYYKENPDKVTVTGAITDLDEEIEKTLMLQEGKEAAAKVSEARVVQQSLRDQGVAVIRNLTEEIKEYEIAGGGDVATARIKNSFQQLLSIADTYRKLGREGGLLLGARRESYRSNRIGINEVDFEIEGLRKQFVNDSGISPEKMVKIIQENIDPTDPEASFARLFKVSRKAQGKHWLDMPTEYWMNAILSGPKTQIVNAMGNGLTQMLTTFEAVMGGIASGNLDVVKAVLASWSDGQMFFEAYKFAKRALKEGDNILDPQARAFNDRPNTAISGQRISEALPGQGLSIKQEKGLDWFANNIVRAPSRLLMTTDEFFKQLAYRRAARLKAAMSGIQQGITDGKELSRYINSTLEGVITEGGRMSSKEGLAREAYDIFKGQTTNKKLLDELDELEVQKRKETLNESEQKRLRVLKQQIGRKRNKFVRDYVEKNFDDSKSALMQYAQDEARYVTFTTEREEGLGKGLEELVNKNKNLGLRFILPFVRTPTNILSFALERLPFTYLNPLTISQSKRLLDEVKDPDPIIRAQARGKITTAAMVTYALYDVVNSNDSAITGGGPKNEKEKAALQATGWKPYSIKIGDTYVSYQRLDPIATPLGVIADLAQVGKDISATESKDDMKLIQHGFDAFIIAMTRNVTNKSYLAGIQNFTDALSDPERYAQRFGNNFVSSFVPNLLSQFADSDEQVMKETRGVGDAILRKIGARGSLDAKRNILGEEIRTETLLASPIQALNPIAISTDKEDPVLIEMANLKHGFTNPSPNVGGNIDLLDYENSQGQTAYDRQLELLKTVRVGGSTLRKTLERLINSREYQQLPIESEPGLPSLRIGRITSVLRKFRKEAERLMLREFPELSQKYANLMKARAGLKGGMQREDVLELLAQ
jgi:soluble cytochrome b562